MDMIILLISLTAKYTQNLPHSDHLQQSTWSQPLFLPDRDISLLPKPVSASASPEQQEDWDDVSAHVEPPHHLPEFSRMTHTVPPTAMNAA